MQPSSAALSARRRRHPWELARDEVLRRLLARTPPAGTVLDIGCGDGWLAERLVRRGQAARVVAVDPGLPTGAVAAFPEVELARSRQAAKLAAGEVTHLLLLDVLEHVEDPEGLLAEALADEAVRDDAWILITVPMHPELHTRHDREVEHHRRYTRAALMALVASTGLVVVEEGAMFASLLAPRALRRLAERALGEHVGPAGDPMRWRAGRLAGDVVKRALVADFALSERLRRRGVRVPGLSHFVIARRGAGA